jgi:hypothetical protein
MRTPPAAIIHEAVFHSTFDEAGAHWCLRGTAAGVGGSAVKDGDWGDLRGRRRHFRGIALAERARRWSG